MKSKAHPSNPRYYPWEVCDAPDRRLHGLLFRGTDLKNTPPSFFPNGTVFQHRKNGTLVLFWNGSLKTIHTLDDPIPTQNSPLS
jgi:hypothetical protein